MKKLTLLALLLLAGCLTACSSKGEPSQIGELLTPEQIATLAGDESWNGKLVAVQGYPKFAKRLVKLDEWNPMNILDEDGNTLMQVTLSIHDGKRTTVMEFGGETSRNYITLTREQSLPEATFTLDDYTEAPYGEFLFSGTLVYDGGTCSLASVTIHQAQ